MTEFRSQETQPSAEQLLQAGGEFLQHFGVEANPTEQPEAFREALKQVDPRYQGDRKLVRWELEADETAWSDESVDVITRTAEAMRMLDPETPLQGDYDVVIVLGGARQSNLDRTNYAVDAIESGVATAKRIVVAGSTRKLKEAEQENTANYAPGAKTEFDLCEGAVKTVTEVNPDLIIDAVKIDDEKAGTPAVLTAVLTSLRSSGGLTSNSKVAAVTTQIYQASTQCDLNRVVQEFGITDAFTAGNPSDPTVVAKRTPATYLSEVLRTLKAAANDVEAEGQRDGAKRAEVAAQIRLKHQRDAYVDTTSFEHDGHGNYIDPSDSTYGIYRAEPDGMLHQITTEEAENYHS